MPYNPNQPRDPKGSRTGGQWTGGSGGSSFWGQTYPDKYPLHVSGKSLLEKLQEGGFSVSVAGKSPTSGYMVSPDKSTEFSKPIEQMTRRDIIKYAREHRKQLAQPGAYLGGWLDNGRAYLDVSLNIQDLATVMNVARRAEQIGVYDVVGGITIYTADYYKDKGQ